MTRLARTLVVEGRPLTGPELQVRAVLDVGARDVLFSASSGHALVRPSPDETDGPFVGDIAVYRVA